MKSGSGFRQRKASLASWLSRNPSVSLSTANDLKYIWAAYKKGALATLGEDFHTPDFTPKELADLLDVYMEVNGVVFLTASAFSEGALKPVGLISVWSRQRIWQVNEISWFPWASARNKFECALKFFDQYRRTEFSHGRKYKILEFARSSERKFFEKMMDLGVLNRVGKVNDLYESEEAVLFETVSI